MPSNFTSVFSGITQARKFPLLCNLFKKTKNVLIIDAEELKFGVCEEAMLLEEEDCFQS